MPIRKVISIATAVAAIAALSGCASFDDRVSSAASATSSARLPVVGDRVQVVDVHGRPPFNRRIVQIDASNVAEFARFEESSQLFERPRSSKPPEIGQRLQVIDVTGRPPFNRRIVQIDASNIAEFARFEEVEQPREKQRRRFGPPGKNGFEFRR